MGSTSAGDAPDAEDGSTPNFHIVERFNAEFPVDVRADEPGLAEWLRVEPVDLDV